MTHFRSLLVLIALSSLLFQGCKKSVATPPPSSVDFTIDLKDNSNSDLSKNGGFIAKNAILIIRYDNTTGPRYYATQQNCTYRNCDLTYLSANNSIQCPCDNCMFDVITGSVIQGPATVSLKTYKTTLTGNSLRIQNY